jgi:hypothetical protein
VRGVRIEPERVVLLLSDGTEDDWHPESTRVGPDGALYATVKGAAPGGPFDAKFTQHAQASLAPVLVDGEAENEASVRIGGRLHAIAPKTARFG